MFDFPFKQKPKIIPFLWNAHLSYVGDEKSAPLSLAVAFRTRLLGPHLASNTETLAAYRSFSSKFVLKPIIDAFPGADAPSRSLCPSSLTSMKIKVTFTP